MKDKINLPRTVIFLPADAKLNFENNIQNPPHTKYNNREQIFDQEAIKKVIGDKYGRQNK